MPTRCSAPPGICSPREADGSTRFRLIGVGADGLVAAEDADLPTLFDRETGRPRRLEQAMDTLNERLGSGTIQLGRGLPASSEK